MHTCLSITFRPKGEILISLLVSVQLLWWITQTLKLNSLLQVWGSFFFLSFFFVKKNLCLGSFLYSVIRDGMCQSVLHLKPRRSFQHRSPSCGFWKAISEGNNPSKWTGLIWCFLWRQLLPPTGLRLRFPWFLHFLPKMYGGHLFVYSASDDIR